MNARELAHELLPRYRDEIVRVVQDLIRLPSQNTPPLGEELGVQQYIATYLAGTGLPVDMYEPELRSRIGGPPGLLARPELPQPAERLFVAAG